jgi:hypothetical protein
MSNKRIQAQDRVTSRAAGGERPGNRSLSSAILGMTMLFPPVFFACFYLLFISDLIILAKTSMDRPLQHTFFPIKAAHARADWNTGSSSIS